MPTYGQRPDDVVQDSRGNALSGVTIRLYGSQTSAEAGGTPLATAVTDSRGRWVYEAAAGELWARLPDTTVWQITDPNNLEDYLNITEGDARYYTQAQVDSALAGVDADVAAAKDRANHTGTQDVSTITGLTEAVVGDMDAALVMGDFINKFYDDVAGEITLSVSPPVFRGEWATGNVHQPGETVARSGNLYSVKALASMLSTPPESDATHYELMVGGGSAATPAAVFDIVDYGAAVDGVTDDTAAWQAALDALGSAGGGEITSSKNGVTVIAGALQDTGGANAQLLLPAKHCMDDEQISVTIRGLTAPPADFSVIGATPTPDNHLVLKSTLASGAGAVIGAKGPTGSANGFTNIHLRLENVAVRTVSNPTLTGLDLRRVACVDLDGVIVDAGTYQVDSVEPTSSGSYGIRLPMNNNGAHTFLGRVAVASFYTGYEFAEHATGLMISAWGCKVGAEFDATNHASVFLRFMSVHCVTGMKWTGAHAVDVWQYNVEHLSSGWSATVYDVDDPSNYGKGFIRWWAVLGTGGFGPHNSFTKNGGTGITTSRLGDAIGSSDYVYRDRLTATTGVQVLTLGATPVANSPLVWVNGSIKWPTTDYTISGTAVTFNSTLTAGDIVAVQYHSTSSSASASALSVPPTSITDTFTRANSSSSLGTTTTGSKTWTQPKGTWGIDSNKAYVSAGVASYGCAAVFDAGVVDCTIAVTVSTTGGAANAGLAFRMTDGSNYYAVDAFVGGSTVPKLWKVVGGTYTSIATGGTAFASGDVLTVVLSGTSIVVKKNGTTIISTTDSTYTTQTTHGLYIESPASTASPARLDDFSLTT